MAPTTDFAGHASGAQVGLTSTADFARQAALSLRLQDAERDLAACKAERSGYLQQADVFSALACEPGQSAPGHNASAIKYRLRAVSVGIELAQHESRIAGLKAMLADGEAGLPTAAQRAGMDSTMGGAGMNAGAEISLRIGQRVRHQDYKGQRVTGIVTALALNGRELMVDVALDAPIVLPEDKYGPEVTIRHQHAPAHEYQPFDDRDELIAELGKALNEAAQSLTTIAKNAGKSRDTDGLENYLQGFEQVRGYAGSRASAASAALAKVTGSAS